MAVEVGLCASASGWLMESGEMVFAGVDVVPGHRAWPRIFGLEAESLDGVPGDAEGAGELPRLRNPLLSVYGQRCSDYGGEVTAELEVSLRSPWRIGASAHGYLCDGVRQWLGDARWETVMAEANGFFADDLSGKYPWRIYGLSWGDESGRANWENSFDGWHWVSQGTLVVKGVK